MPLSAVSPATLLASAVLESPHRSNGFTRTRNTFREGWLGEPCALKPGRPIPRSVLGDWFTCPGALHPVQLEDRCAMAESVQFMNIPVVLCCHMMSVARAPLKSQISMTFQFERRGTDHPARRDCRFFHPLILTNGKAAGATWSMQTSRRATKFSPANTLLIPTNSAQPAGTTTGDVRCSRPGQPKQPRKSS